MQQQQHRYCNLWLFCVVWLFFTCTSIVLHVFIVLYLPRCRRIAITNNSFLRAVCLRYDIELFCIGLASFIFGTVNNVPPGGEIEGARAKHPAAAAERRGGGGCVSGQQGDAAVM